MTIACPYCQKHLSDAEAKRIWATYTQSQRKRKAGGRPRKVVPGEHAPECRYRSSAEIDPDCPRCAYWIVHKKWPTV